MIVAISLTPDEQEFLLGIAGQGKKMIRPRVALDIAAKIRKSRCEEEAWEEILSDEEKLITSLASRRKCPTCHREFQVRRNGELRLHRDAYGKACAGEQQRTVPWVDPHPPAPVREDKWEGGSPGREYWKPSEPADRMT